MSDSLNPLPPTQPAGLAVRAKSFARRVARWWGGQEPLVFVVLLIVVGGVWAFVQIADEVGEGDTLHFDTLVIRSLRRPDNLAEPIGPPWLKEVGRDITALGGLVCLAMGTFAVVGYLWLDGKRRMAIVLLISTAGGVAMSSLLKSLFARPRPDIVPHLSDVYTSSFPSGHSMLSAVVYLTLGALIAASARRRLLKIYALVLALAISALVGLSRIYLGVHYPTDVLGGWTAGLVWALLCWLVARWLQRHGEVETPKGQLQS